MKPIIFISFLFPYFVIARRTTHVEILHMPNEGDSLQASVMYGPRGATLWESEDELTVRFDKDATTVTVKPNSVQNPRELFDVYLESTFVYTCAFRTTRDIKHDSVLFNIIKEGRFIKIAESPDSTCTPNDREYSEEEVKKRFKREHSLRLTLLKAKVQKSLKERRVRFLV